MWYERCWRWAKEHLTITVPGVVLIFAATYIVMLAVNAGEVGAAWVQAVGSILALVGAAALPVWHARINSKDAEEEAVQLLSTLGHYSYDLIELILGVFAEDEKWQLRIRVYLSIGADKEWEPLIAALNQIPMERLPNEHALNLMAVSGAVNFARFVATEMESWSARGYYNKGQVDTLDGKVDVLAMALQKLPTPHHKLKFAKASE